MEPKIIDPELRRCQQTVNDLNTRIQNLEKANLMLENIRGELLIEIDNLKQHCIRYDMHPVNRALEWIKRYYGPLGVIASILLFILGYLGVVTLPWIQFN
jgi:hypothetical protein